RSAFLAGCLADALPSALAERISTRRRREATAAPPPSGAGALGTWAFDLLSASRRLRRSPASTALALITLAVGLGVSTAVYTLVDGVLLRPLPYPAPDALVRVWASRPADGELRLDSTWAETRTLEDLSCFAGVGAYSIAPRDLLDHAGHPAKIRLARVSKDFFHTLGVSPVLGRGFEPADLTEGRPVVLLSHGFWLQRYGSDPSVLGRDIDIQGSSHRIAGVMPASFALPADVALWRPFTLQENQDDDRELTVLARLAPGVSLEAAGSEVLRATGHLARTSPEAHAGFSAWIEPLGSSLSSRIRGPLLTLLWAVGGIWLLACGNVALVQLSRGFERSREMALRSALGAEQGRLVRQLVLETLLLAGAGGLLGLALGSGLVQTLLQLAPHDLPRSNEIGLHSRVAVPMALLALVSGLIAGWLPALRTAERSAGSLRSKGDAPTGDRLRSALVVVQVGMATWLAVSAALLFTSLERRTVNEPGLDLRRTVDIGLSPPQRADDRETRSAFYRQAADAVRGLPEVAAAGLGSFQPLEPRAFRMPFLLDESLAESTERYHSQDGGSDGDTEVDPFASATRAAAFVVDAAWIQAAGIRLVAGQMFEADSLTASGEGVAIVDELFARRYLGGQAVGERIRHPAYFGDALPSRRTVVGVVAAVRTDAAAEPAPRIYLPHTQFPWPRMHILARTHGDPAAAIPRIRARIWTVDPAIPLDRAETVGEIASRTFAQQRFESTLMASFTVLALLLASVGLYAVLAVHVSHSTRELGIRRALGARKGHLSAWLLGRAARLL
ncbi:MAG: ABC transporter permease, partial [Holophagales bacterium]|nr:ABC transporter permease [Holophagales bacterium]